MAKAPEAEQALQPPASLAGFYCNKISHTYREEHFQGSGVGAVGSSRAQSPGRPHKFVLQCETWKVNMTEPYITWKESGSVHSKVESMLSQKYVKGQAAFQRKGRWGTEAVAR